MFKINYSFEEESGRDGLDPLGNISISDERSTILLRTTFLDSWFAALVDALEQIQIKKHVSVEIAEEPKALTLDVASGGQVFVTYAHEKVVAQTRQALQAALRTAACSFLAAVVGLPEANSNATLDPIRKFCAAR